MVTRTNPWPYYLSTIINRVEETADDSKVK